MSKLHPIGAIRTRPEDVIFRTNDDKVGAYKNIYEIAYSGFSERIQNYRGIYLSRIPKRNGKHRYYLTRECMTAYCDGCGSGECSPRFCRGGIYYDGYYVSQYVGTDIANAIAELEKCEYIEDTRPMKPMRPEAMYPDPVEEITEW